MSKVERKMYWIRGKILIVSLDQNFWYMACSNCRKSISARDKTLFDCFHCNRKKVVAKPRVKFEVLLTDASGSMTATMFENHAVEYCLVDGKTRMKYAAENDQNVVAIFPKLAMENEYWILLKTQEYPSHGVKVLASNINNIKPAFNEDSSKEEQPTTTANSPLAENKAKKKLFQEDDNPTRATTTSEETQ